MDFQIGFWPYNTKRWIIDKDQILTCGVKPIMISHLWAEKLEPVTIRKKSTSRDGTEDEIDIIFKKLKEKHPDKGSPAVRLWARLIQNGRWDNYDNPPPIPLITL